MPRPKRHRRARPFCFLPHILARAVKWRSGLSRHAISGAARAKTALCSLQLVMASALDSRKTFFCQIAVLRFKLDPDITAAIERGGNGCGPRTRKRVEHNVSGSGKGVDQGCNDTDRFLGGMRSVAGVNPRLHVADRPARFLLARKKAQSPRQSGSDAVLHAATVLLPACRPCRKSTARWACDAA